ncbi:MAG TPA: hypothetical protein VK530_16325 [Candidatus Acidoferrum sp.]|nr:hypothetical protein [Candidatus Acidoferrum sp.]
MNWLRSIVLGTAILLASTALGQITGIEPLKGFKLVDYYHSPSGKQTKKAVLTAAEGRIITTEIYYLVHPRIEHYNEDGSLLGVATAVDAMIDLPANIVWGTNVISFRGAETNLYLTGRGFLWQPSNTVLIISNQSYTWIDRTRFTNSPSKK